jgi:hypothetical protein
LVELLWALLAIRYAFGVESRRTKLDFVGRPPVRYLEVPLLSTPFLTAKLRFARSVEAQNVFAILRGANGRHIYRPVNRPCKPIP